jgi:hypothetical protein
VADSRWETFWKVYLFIQIGLAIFVTIWFSIGGMKDIRAMFRRLREMERDPRDDGKVGIEPIEVRREEGWSGHE